MAGVVHGDISGIRAIFSYIARGRALISWYVVVSDSMLSVLHATLTYVPKTHEYQTDPLSSFLPGTHTAHDSS